jgi:hypothetical protein
MISMMGVEQFATDRQRERRAAAGAYRVARAATAVQAAESPRAAAGRQPPPVRAAAWES